MNRQARLQNPGLLFENYGNVSLLEAARRHAVRLVGRGYYAPNELPIEVRCESSPEIPPRVFQVRIDLVATVLNPRLDTDKAE